MMIARDDLPMISESAKMDEAILVMTEKNLGAVLVVDENKELLGIFTDGDLKRHMAPDLLEKTVSTIMSRNPKTISQNALAVEALDMMTKTPGKYLTSLIVTDEHGKLAGMIRLQDCLQAGIA